MSKSTEAWMPLYVGDYLGDTQRLTTEQHGAYILLILDYWRNGPPPNDDAVLQSITKLDRQAWKRNRPAIERLFRIADGLWTHKRIEQEIENAKANQNRRSSKAQKAAQARWGKSSDDAPSNAPSMPQALLDDCPPPSPSSSPKGSEEVVVDSAGASALDAIDLADDLCRMAGVRNIDPPAIIRHQGIVNGWLAEGFDPDGEIIPTIRQAIADADTERIHSLAYFDPIIRQARARREAQEHGHQKQAKRGAVAASGADVLAMVRERRAQAAER